MSFDGRGPLFGTSIPSPTTMSWKSKARAKRAEILSQQMRHGDSAAAFSLLQRGRALKSLKSGYRWKLELATAARKRAEAKLAVEKRAEQRRLSEQCTFKDEKVLDAFSRAMK